MKKNSFFKVIFLLLLILCLLAGMVYVLQLDKQITSRFEGRRWELPARIYARSLELYVGQTLSVKNLEKELLQLRYSRVTTPEKPGEYSVRGKRITIHSRSFPFPDLLRPATTLELEILETTITQLTDQSRREALTLFRLEPVQYASIYPTHNEDRLLIKSADVPELLIKTLLLVEDKSFYKHLGIRPTAIIRAALANLRAGKTVQGGSTLTQQLVKNIFLSSEQTLPRKVNEAVMALLLEYHYTKDEIMEAYLNEVYLGQDGKRAIHGFAMASRFYFGRDLAELEPAQIALLVGIVKGASYYNPRRHPERAKVRRNQVLNTLISAQVISPEKTEQLLNSPLTVSPKIPSGITPYPAFLELVRNQLQRDYKDEDLRSEGLSIYTTLDPIIQQRAEASLAEELARLEKPGEVKAGKMLQAALVVASVDQGEVVAVVGNRTPGQEGFNRALDMKRPIGSVIKPAVYLTALSRPESYNLLTTLYDTPLKVPLSGKDWQPENYDHQFHGPLPLIEALAHSSNVATVQLGMDLGLDAVITTLQGLGIEGDIARYPSLLLGAIELSPVDVLQMYQTIAAGGYKTPLRAILAVTDQENTTLQRYPLTVEQAADPRAVFCLTTALQAATTRGTAKSLQHLLPKGLTVAGKTGTTDGLRDSWFAGFSGQHVAVAWVGRDDNTSTGLTGSTGALKVWAATMSGIGTSPLQAQRPDNIDWYYTDLSAGKILSQKCGNDEGSLLPFIHGGLLPEASSCNKQQEEDGFGQKLQRGLHNFLDFLD
ncbi:MAG: penicillin-binding protein 1B [Proteobacteria bacterium]|nr:penicillin-binding protein 1B [Pseudomonadota bacterium]MBU1058177.1 penicillin-binding protein 1B [Pseudomonadota bacterium]